MEVWYRPNECGDFGAWRFMFDKLGEKYKKYKRFMFVNDTVRGPYINPTILELIKQKGVCEIKNNYIDISLKCIE